MFIFLGWLVGLVVGTVGIVALLLAGGASVPAFLSGFGSILATFLAALAPWLAVTLAALFIVASFLFAYLGATASIAPLLPGATGLAPVTFPLASPLSTPGGVAVTIPASPGEFFARGVLIGLSAAINSVLLLLIAGTVLGVWAFFVISLAAIIFVARNRVYQGFLGWSAWLFPLSYLATGVGLLLFVVNFLFAFATFGVAAFALDWSTGVIETRGGVTGITGFNGGFSLGNFTFLTRATAAGAGPAPARFMTPTISSHETGHSLNTAAMGGVVLWINAIDENFIPGSMNLAYGELTAEGHSRNMPGVALADYSLRLWV